MIFNGDLSKYHPADAIMFLSQLNLNGVLSIAEDQRLITLGFDNGFIVDAYSAKGDAKVLQSLIYSGKVTADQVKRIRRIQEETGLSIRSILTQLDLFPLSTVTENLLTGMNEVLLEMFLLDKGGFHFTDTPVEKDGAETKLDACTMALSIAALSDEYRDWLAGIGSLDREISLSESLSASLSTEKKVVLRLIDGCRTLGQVFEKAPFHTATVLEIVREQIEKEVVILSPADAAEIQLQGAAGTDPLFAAYRQAFKKLMSSDDPMKRIETLVNFCKGLYDVVLILTAKEGQVVHCKQMRYSKERGLFQKSTAGQLGRLNREPVFEAVYRSGVGFFGSRFPSELLEKFSGQAESGECALIPMVIKGQVAVFLYVFSAKGFTGISPQQYLELLSWMVTPKKTLPGGEMSKEKEGDPAEAKDEVAAAGGFNAKQLVARINELPPLPTVVTRAMDMLSDPEVDIREVEKVIGNDQSLVTKLIKISNSVLYGGLQRVESLSQALARLGAKTTKNLILTASMKAYFFRNNPGMHTWGQSLWQHAAECGMAARRIAVAVGYEDPEKAFVGGVLHDIGKLVLLLVSGDTYRRIQSLKKRESLCDHEAEKKILKTDHMEIGELLMEKWNMPASAKACVKFHHHVQGAEADPKLVRIIAYANHLSHLHGTPFQWFVFDPEAVSKTMVEDLGMSADVDAKLVEAVITDFQQTDLLE
ncbi:HDOD domain-containing protein [uncultured Desulfosarcina sp.]|uniref:HDOD domain-containing protein n=1 Tax=uncultured Desulfosarcina sp. TaxID=218289 RepID=UPI0029C943DF|nr:HDOD domain-containing protein [uncultured Desulfosarcina sp.]